MVLTLEELLNRQIKTEQEKPSTSVEQPASLLDMLIKTEGPDHGESSDPLEQIGDIGETVISQFSREEEEAVKNNAMKLFDQAMSYNKAPTEVKQKRKYTKWKSVSQQDSTLKFPVKLAAPEAARPLQFYTMKESIERKKNSPKKDRNIARLHKTTREWTEQEKTDFSKYCEMFGVGRLVVPQSDLIKLYMNSFNRNRPEKPQLEPQAGTSEETVKVEIPSPTKRKSNHKVEEVKWYEQEKLEDVSRQEDPHEMVVKLEPPDEDLREPMSVPAVKFAPFHPGMKYEKEKLFRVQVIEIFMEVFLVENEEKSPVPSSPLLPVHKRRGRPKKYAVKGDASENLDALSVKKKDLEHLIERFNTVMENEKKEWTPEEVEELGKFYERFKEKLNFTIIQTKELGTFLRRTFGRLEQYEIDREKDTLLAEKRKFWQEYKIKHEKPRKKANILRSAPVRPYIRQNLNLQGETEEEKKKRKAAYLREWRERRAEKQNLELQFRIANNNEVINGQVSSEISEIM